MPYLLPTFDPTYSLHRQYPTCNFLHKYSMTTTFTFIMDQTHPIFRAYPQQHFIPFLRILSAEISQGKSVEYRWRLGEDGTRQMEFRVSNEVGDEAFSEYRRPMVISEKGTEEKKPVIPAGEMGQLQTPKARRYQVHPRRKRKPAKNEDEDSDESRQDEDSDESRQFSEYSPEFVASPRRTTAKRKNNITTKSKTHRLPRQLPEVKNIAKNIINAFLKFPLCLAPKQAQQIVAGKKVDTINLSAFSTENPPKDSALQRFREQMGKLFPGEPITPSSPLSKRPRPDYNKRSLQQMLLHKETKLIFRFWLFNLGHYYMAQESRISARVVNDHREAIDVIIKAIDNDEVVPSFSQNVKTIFEEPVLPEFFRMELDERGRMRMKRQRAQKRNEGDKEVEE